MRDDVRARHTQLRIIAALWAHLLVAGSRLPGPSLQTVPSAVPMSANGLYLWHVDVCFPDQLHELHGEPHAINMCNGTFNNLLLPLLQLRARGKTSITHKTAHLQMRPMLLPPVGLPLPGILLQRAVRSLTPRSFPKHPSSCLRRPDQRRSCASRPWRRSRWWCSWFRKL